MNQFTIRWAEIKDCAAILHIYQIYISEDTATFEYEIPSLNDFTTRCNAIMQKYPFLVYEEEGNILGYAYASKFKERAAYQWDVEVSVYIDNFAKGKGIGKQLYKSLLRLLQEQGVIHAYACITIPNEASIGLHKSFGFTEVGIFHQAGYKFQQWLDIIWLEKMLNPPIVDPTPLLTIADLQLKMKL